MSFTPHPIIPQTAEQAAQRDQLHGIASQPVETSAQKALRLERAIHDHRESVQSGADPMGEADVVLWAHITSHSQEDHT